MMSYCMIGVELAGEWEMAKTKLGRKQGKIIQECCLSVASCLPTGKDFQVLFSREGVR